MRETFEQKASSYGEQSEAGFDALSADPALHQVTRPTIRKEKRITENAHFKYSRLFRLSLSRTEMSPTGASSEKLE